MSLTAYERWMVSSNLETIRSTGVSVETQAARLRANGYPRIAQALLACAFAQAAHSSQEP